MTADQHLEHLLWLTTFRPNDPPAFVREWSGFAERKAISLAARGGEFANLPQRLAQAMKPPSSD